MTLSTTISPTTITKPTNSTSARLAFPIVRVNITFPFFKIFLLLSFVYFVILLAFGCRKIITPEFQWSSSGLYSSLINKPTLNYKYPFLPILGKIWSGGNK